MTIWALHGFLGLPSDFDELKSKCLELKPDLQWNAVDYLHLRELSPNYSLKEWGVRFNQYVSKNSDPQNRNVLLGYSQGGRLALHALENQPGLWSACLLLSANPGIREAEKPARSKQDREWADRFLNDNFIRTVEKWNAQSVFQGSKTEPQRLESQFNRRQLADCLIQWSVANQENFSRALSHNQIPLLYVAGETDAKYCQIGQALQLSNAQIEFEKIPNSGHRVLFDQPAILAEKIIQFLAKKNA